LKIITCPVPIPTAQEILIKVHYAGVNRPDALQRAGLYNAPPGANQLLGLEVSGEIIAIGEKSTKWKIGTLVTALVPGGGYSEYVVTNEDHALRIPYGLIRTRYRLMVAQVFGSLRDASTGILRR
jgi:NADPH:quinone reductase-like Zn-dependent oxidoreductase